MNYEVVRLIYLLSSKRKMMSKVSDSPDDAINEGLDKSFESIKNLLEGKGGKVEY